MENVNRRVLWISLCSLYLKYIYCIFFKNFIEVLLTYVYLWNHYHNWNSECIWHLQIFSCSLEVSPFHPCSTLISGNHWSAFCYFILLDFTFRSMIYFVLIFIYSMRYESKFPPPPPKLEKLFIIHCISFGPLSKISCSFICGFSPPDCIFCCINYWSFIIILEIE